MRNIKLTIAYDGSDFHGWQIQPGERTIQGLLGAVLSKITQEQIILHGAGRTDAGVHAWGQVANFTTHSEIPAAQLARALNALLPPSIRIRDAQEVDADFHARWRACAKTYAYRIYRGAIVPPFLWRYVLHYPFPLDFAAMSEAARRLEGHHDFTSFAASSGSEEIDQERITERSIYRSEWLLSSADMPVGLLAAAQYSGPADMQASDPAASPEWLYLIRGRSFLRHMVRKIVGTLLEVGRGRLTPQDIPRLLALRDPTSSGPTAPAQGLWLLSIEYPDMNTPG